MKEDKYIGKKYGRWTVIERDFKTEKLKKYKNRYYFCKCSCDGKIKSVNIQYLRSGQSTSCGCYAIEERIKRLKKLNEYDLSGEFGIGYTFKNEPFYFDLEDYDLIKNYCWHYGSKGYVVSARNNTTIRMHRLVINCPNNMQVDHIKGIKYDNRKSQLRICTNGENQKNQNSKGYRFDKNAKKWYAYININGKQTHLGAFETEKEAKEIRYEAEREHYGEFAYDRGLNNEK